MSKKIVVGLLSGLLILLLVGSSVLNYNVLIADKTECKDNEGEKSWGGEDHDDNNPSENKGEKMIENGAGICDVAKKCDHMEIDIAIDNKKELHETEMYQNAPEHYQEELDEYAEEGSGHDNPNLVCYEVEEAISGE